MNIFQTCSELVKTYGCRLLSEIGATPSDIDIFIPSGNVAPAKRFLLGLGFTETGWNIGQDAFSRFEGGSLYLLDLMSGLTAYTEWQTSVKLSPEGELLAASSPTLHKPMKYLMLRRLDKLPELTAAKLDIERFFATPSNFIYIHPKTLKAASGNIKDLLQSINPNRWITWRNRWRRIGRGKSFAFIGPDGSGKGFFIDRIKNIGDTRVVYMGDWFFKLQDLYNILMKLPVPLNRVVYLCYIFENYFRMMRVFIFRALGFVVLLDRFPGTNRNVAKRGFLGWLNNATFHLFPNPDYFLLLMAPPKVVYARKQELGIDEIYEIQQSLITQFSSTRHLIVDTEELDKSLNIILATAYYHDRV